MKFSPVDLNTLIEFLERFNVLVKIPEGLTLLQNFIKVITRRYP